MTAREKGESADATLTSAADPPPRTQVSVSDAVNRAAEVLKRRREQLHALDGVIGSGIGASPRGGVAIQVFVRSPKDVLDVQRGAVELLQGIPLEVVVSGDVTGAVGQEGGEDG